MTPRLVCLDLRGDRIRPVSAPIAPAVLCLGNFDGVHLAHAALLKKGKALKEAMNASCGQNHILCGAFCFFSPSGDHFLPPDIRPTHLTTLKERIHILKELGADLVWLCDFSAVRDLPAEDFIQLLQSACLCVGAICGYNHRFGQNAQGSPDLLLRRFGEDCAFVMPPLRMGDDTISSTRIRTCLREGNVEEASLLLGRPYALQSRVIHGKSLGNTWGFPTANQVFPADRLIPAFGVYAARCHTPLGIYLGVANVGLRPTVEDPGRVNCETYLIDFSGNLYGHSIKVEFLKFLRREQKFGSAEELIAAIRRDVKTAVELFPLSF